MVKDNQDLSKTLSLLEQDVRETTKVVNSLYDEKTVIEKKYKKSLENIKNLKSDFENYKQKIREKDVKDQDKLKKDLKQIRDNYNNQIAQLEKNLKNKRKNTKLNYSVDLDLGI